MNSHNGEFCWIPMRILDSILWYGIKSTIEMTISNKRESHLISLSYWFSLRTLTLQNAPSPPLPQANKHCRVVGLYIEKRHLVVPWAYLVLADVLGHTLLPRTASNRPEHKKNTDMCVFKLSLSTFELSRQKGFIFQQHFLLALESIENKESTINTI